MRKLFAFMICFSVLVVSPVAAQSLPGAGTTPTGQPSALVTAVITFLTAVAPLAVGINRALKNHSELIEGLRADFKEASDALERERSESQKMRQLADEKTHENELLTKQLNELQPKFQEMQSQIDKLKGIQEQLEKATALQESLTLERNNIRDERERYKSDNVLLTQTLEARNNEYEALSQENKKLNDEVNRLTLVETEYKAALKVWDQERAVYIERLSGGTNVVTNPPQ